MVRRAIESGERQFGIALPQTTKQRYVEYGTMLDIRDCVQLGDGCSILSTVGTRRFRVIQRGEKDGYDTAKVEFIKDEPIADDRYGIVMELHRRVLHKAKQWCENLPDNIKGEILKTFGHIPDLEKNWETNPDGPAWTWWIISILPLSQLLKVSFSRYSLRE
jgi:Lon protease-like protein